MFQGSGRAISALTRGDYKQKGKKTPFSYFLISTEIFNISTIIFKNPFTKNITRSKNPPRTSINMLACASLTLALGANQAHKSASHRRIFLASPESTTKAISKINATAPNTLQL